MKNVTRKASATTMSGFSKTYFAIPTTIYQPDDLIQLGQVIKDPTLPFERLAPPPKLEGALKPRISSLKECVVTSQKTRAMSVGLVAHALEFINSELSAEKSSAETLTWEAAEIETHFFEPTADDSFIAQLCANKAVRQGLKRFGFGQSAYVITGLKIALNPGPVSCRVDHGAGVSAQLAAVVDPTGAIQAGVQASSTRTAGVSVEGKATHSYVFAYQLRKVSVNPVTGKAAIGAQRKGGDLYGIEDDAGSDSDLDWDEDLDSSGDDEDEEAAGAASLELAKGISLDGEDYGAKLPGAVFARDKVDIGDEDKYYLVRPK